MKVYSSESRFTSLLCVGSDCHSLDTWSMLDKLLELSLVGLILISDSPQTLRSYSVNLPLDASGAKLSMYHDKGFSLFQGEK